jgi:hypothetical protein
MSSMKLLSVMWIIGEKSPLVSPRCEGITTITMRMEIMRT